MLFCSMQTQQLYQLFIASSGVSTDTRTLEKGALFFALKGDNFNGNLFAEKALSLGAIAVIVDDSKLKDLRQNIIVVKDTLKTLQELARYHRKQLNTPIISITGSNGKTTTKELIREVLSQKYKVHATKGNLNNHIGVPLTLLELKKEHEIAVIEMGANHQTEIKSLCEITFPNWGYITNFGKAHLEGFGGEEGVIKGKSEIYLHLMERQQKILINGDDTIQKKQTVNYPTCSFGHLKENTFQVNFNENSFDSLQLTFNKETFTSPLYGGYNLGNISAAVIFGHIYEVPIKSIQFAIQNYQATNNRSQKIKIKNVTLVMDAYNANPTSMELAIQTFEKEATHKSAVILGDMKELGTSSEKEHQNIIDYCLKSKLEYIHVIGPCFSKIDAENFRVKKHKNLVAFKSFINSLSQIDYDKILIKGSRSMKLETMLPLLKSKI